MIVHKKKKIITIIALSLILVLVVFFLFSTKKKPQKEVAQRELPTFTFSEQGANGKALFSGIVQPTEKVFLHPESSGILKKLYVKEGDIIHRGKKIAQLENINQRLLVQKARVAYESAKLQLEKMQEHNNTGNQNSGISRITQSQKSLVSAAKNAYLNADIRAYPEDFDINDLAPKISGNYSCDKQGEYVLEVYSSGAPEGASFRLSGLETAVESVSVTHPVPLGSCGLEIVFDTSFSKNKTWIIPVPNTRSARAIQAKQQYETQLAGKDLALKQGIIDVKDIQYQKKLVDQAALGLEAARIALNKTTLISPVEGKIEELLVDEGNLISPASLVGKITSSDFEIVAQVPLRQRAQMKVQQKGVFILNNKEYPVQVSSFADISGDMSQSKKVHFSFTQKNPEFIGGEIGELYLELPYLFQRTPRSFVGFGYDGAFVVCDDKKYLVQIHDEDEEYYFIKLKGDQCHGTLTLPHLYEKK